MYVATHLALHALDLGSGAERWQAALGTRPAIVGAPALAEGRLFVTVGPRLQALEAASGAALWQAATAGTFYPPAAGHGLVFAGSADGHLYALDAATGEEQWKFRSQWPGEGDVWSAPGVAGGLVLAGSRDGTMYALDALTGEPAWAYATAGEAVGDPVISDGVVYFSDSNHVLPSGTRRLLALDAATGEALWTYETVSTLLTTPALEAGGLYVTVTGAVLKLK